MVQETHIGTVRVFMLDLGSFSMGETLFVRRAGFGCAQPGFLGVGAGPFHRGEGT